MKVGIFGGTFNPPHKTHRQIALQAKKQLQLDKLFVVPCGIPPHKPCDVDSATRLKLAQLAFGDIAEVSDCEVKREGQSYTVDTLGRFREEFPQAQLFLVIGGDSFLHFEKWKNPREIARLATLAVADREEKTSQEAVQKVCQNVGAKAVFLDVIPDEVSSTDVRLRYQFGLDNSCFVRPTVDKYILENGLYTSYRPIAEKLKNYLPEKRFMHTFYVVKRGLELATEQEKDKVFLACLLHDCAKYISEENYEKYGFEKKNIPDPVVHSFLGALVAKQDFGITDGEILSAIAYHTTGRPNMSRLEKIVYVSDKTEQTRPYPLEHLLKGTLDEQFLACLDEANSYTTAHHGTNVFPLTEETLQFYFPNRKK